ncbi:dolichyl-phosphate-mannose-protein mannosyltransferase [Scheffersomyces coipomensis]|uniref:dolichyl-phosphate-mannose-protein mannosyltransferase n=1 Tax=Scheffersomyces coipomensis TaxID=1788519 RepID=UPI00315C5392
MIEKSSKLPPGYKPGIFRSFFSTTPSPQLLQQTTITKYDRANLCLLLTLGSAIRLYKLWLPSRIVFDEIHLGTFLKFYFHGEFFLDVHPPLVKLIYYWLSILFHWNGQMEFNRIGELYNQDIDHEFPYLPLRLFSSLCGVGTVLLTYLILRYSNCRSIVALFGSGLVLIENSLVTHSRLILLDSPFIFSLALVIYGIKRSQLQSPLSKAWFKSLIVIGMGLGLSLSIKLVAIFTFLWCGILTVQQLWQQLGDLEISTKKWSFQIISKLVIFIVFPLVIYCSIFTVHFEALPFSGEGAGILSPFFKSSLTDFEYLKQMPVDVSYGSTITIKHVGTEAYLHSHNFTYLSGSGEQQVSLYEFMPDINNEWIIEIKNKNVEGKLQKQFKPIKDGDTVRLFHKATGRYLHVNDVRPPVSEHDYANEVSCNSDRNQLGDVNYEFKIRIIDRSFNSENELPLRKLKATQSIFQLVHVGTKCVVMSHITRLPEWGFGQYEVLCVDEPTIPNTLWYIEENSHPKIDNDENYPRIAFPQYSFFRKIWELHKSMIRINSSFTSHHRYSSKPETWPWLLRGVNYFSNEGTTKYIDENPSHIYFLGNMMIYYTANIIILLTFTKLFIYTIKHLNPFHIPFETINVSTYYANSFEFLLGWFIHYAPFFYMERELFLHHYLPALYFSILLLAQFIEYQISKRKYIGYGLMIIIGVGSSYCFYQFLPLIYGLDWSVSECNQSKWFSSWDFDCMTYAN